MKRENNRFEIYMDWFKNHKLYSVIFILVIVYISFSNILDITDKNIELFKKYKVIIVNDSISVNDTLSVPKATGSKQSYRYDQSSENEKLGNFNLIEIKENIDSTSNTLSDKHKLYPLSIMSYKSGHIYVENEFIGISNTTLNLTQGNYDIKVIIDSIEYRELVVIPNQNLITINR